MMILDYKKIENMNTEFYRKHYNYLADDHHLVRTPGEWYKFLTYISYLYNGITILDVGTCWGESAIALSQNKNNKVITYDIHVLWENEHNPNHKPFLSEYPNLEMKVMDINQETDEVIKSAQVIIFDIKHDGIQEKIFSDRLTAMGYKGYVICDDIFSQWYPAMRTWWDSIEIEKWDITEIAHNSGTGLINYYEDDSIEIIR